MAHQSWQGKIRHVPSSEQHFHRTAPQAHTNGEHSMQPDQGSESTRAQPPVLTVLETETPIIIPPIPRAAQR
jgi:hypothetical protein